MFSHIRERLNIISGKLRERFPDSIVSVIVFGSRVRGDYKEWSDIDLMIIIKEKNPHLEKKIIELIVDEEIASGLSFTPVLKDIQSFKKEKRYKTPFYESIEREGVTL
jgi:predicted nucleotidyltransferase